MSSKLEQALQISLDDYIAEKGIVSSLRSKSQGTAVSTPGYFKRQLRSEADDDDNEEDLFIEDREGMVVEELGDTPPPLIREFKTDNDDQLQQQTEDDKNDVDKMPHNLSVKVDSDMDVRTFITEEQKRGIRHMPSQQWRLQRKNQVSKKPPGVPPLMSVKTVFDQNTEMLIASLGENAKFQSNDARKHINNRLNNMGNRNNNRNWNNQNNNRNNNNNWNNNRNSNNNRNRNQYGKNPSMAPSFNPNVSRFDHRSTAQIDKSQIADLRPYITPPSSVQSQANALVGQPMWNNPAQFGQPQLVTFADMLNSIGQASTTQDRSTFANVIRNVMRNQQQQPQQQAAVLPVMNPAQMNSTELMPYAAQTLLNHITTVQQNFGPKYDMKVQKDIHALQGKSMLYRSSGVVSMDGPGLGNERINPTTTDLSMNMRFS